MITVHWHTIELLAMGLMGIWIGYVLGHFAQRYKLRENSQKGENAE